MASFQARHSHIWSIAWPMILANVAVTFIGIVDTAILGHLHNPAFLGGAAIASSLFNIIYMSLAFLRMGTTGLIAQHYGEKQWQDLYATLSLSAVLALCIGSVLVILASWLFQVSIPLIGGSDEVRAVAYEFAMIRVLSSPFVLFNFVALGFLVGIQKSQQALYLLLFSQSINIFLDFYLAVYLDWQVAGIAWATAISDFFGSLLALFFMINFFKNKIGSYRLLPELTNKLIRIFNLNRDIFSRTIILISIFAFITAQSARQGDIILAANSILIQIFFFLANAIDGFANAAETKTGEAVGNHRKDSSLNVNQVISDSYSIALQQAFMFLSIGFVVLYFFSDSILLLISNQAALLESTRFYFPWLYLLLYCCVVCFVIDGVFIGAAKGRTMLLAILVSTLLVFFPAWYFSQALGNHGLWLALCCFMLFRSGLSQLLYRQIQKQNNWSQL